MSQSHCNAQKTEQPTIQPIRDLNATKVSRRVGVVRDIEHGARSENKGRKVPRRSSADQDHQQKPLLSHQAFTVKISMLSDPVWVHPGAYLNAFNVHGASWGLDGTALRLLREVVRHLSVEILLGLRGAATTTGSLATAAASGLAGRLLGRSRLRLRFGARLAANM